MRNRPPTSTPIADRLPAGPWQRPLAAATLAATTVFAASVVAATWLACRSRLVPLGWLTTVDQPDPRAKPTHPNRARGRHRP